LDDFVFLLSMTVSIFKLGSQNEHNRFTNSETESMSLYNITNSWNGITYAVRPTLNGDTYFTSGDTVLGLGSTKYLLKVNIDSKGDTTIDVTGDSGQSSSYQASSIASSINSALQASYTSQGYPYQTYEYVTYNNARKYFTFKSPSRDKDSSLLIKPTTGDTDARDVLFGLTTGDTDEYYASGDFYLEYNSSQDRMDIVRLNTSNNTSKIPDGSFYVHYIWDRREGDSLTDEYTYQTHMNDKKIIGINNIFKQTKFTTFDIIGTVYYSNTYSKNVVKKAVETALYEQYSFVNSSGEVVRDYGEDVLKSKILSIIQGIDGVEYVSVSFFGKDATDSSTNEDNIISCNFDEIIILRETSGSRGVIFTYTAVEAN